MTIAHRWARSLDHEDQATPKKLGVWAQSVINWTIEEENSIADLHAYALSDKRVFGHEGNKEVGLAHLLCNAVDIMVDIRATLDRITKEDNLPFQHS
jgi:hypothetical protein